MHHGPDRYTRQDHDQLLIPEFLSCQFRASHRLAVLQAIQAGDSEKFFLHTKRMGSQPDFNVQQDVNLLVIFGMSAGICKTTYDYSQWLSCL